MRMTIQKWSNRKVIIEDSSEHFIRVCHSSTTMSTVSIFQIHNVRVYATALKYCIKNYVEHNDFYKN